MKNFSLQIEAFLLGELDEQELADFEQALRNDPELALAVEQHREMLLLIEGARIRKKTAAALKPTPPEAPGAAVHPIWMLAGALLAAVIAYWYFSGHQLPTPAPPPVSTPAPASTLPDTTPSPVHPGSTKPQQPPNLMATNKPMAMLLKTYYVPYNGAMVRSANEPTRKDTAFIQALTAFDEGRYKLASKILEDDRQLGPGDSGRFFRAHARFRAEYFALAAADFKKLENSFQYKYEARWNALLCEIALGNGKTAGVTATLDAMIADPDFPFNEEAKRLKKTIPTI